MKQATRRSFRTQLLISMFTLLMGLVTVFGVEAPVYAAKQVDPDDFCKKHGFEAGYITYSTNTITCWSPVIDPTTGRRLARDQMQDFHQ